VIKLTTARILVRNFSPADWQDLREVIIDKEASPYAVYDYPFPTGEREVKDIAAWFSQNDAYLAIVEISTGKIFSYIVLNGTVPAEYDLGFCLHSAYQDKGYAYEACSALVDYAFNVLKVNRLTSGTAVANLRSSRLLGKLGFHKTGEAVASFWKDAEGKPVEFTGASFELTKDAWLKTY
jgi:[ribosomal protein S5]-alanine N-acetyltransferase